MADIQEQTQLANEVSEAISANTYAGVDIDEVGRPPPLLCCSLLNLLQEELKAELAGLEDEELDKRLMGADHVPVHHPGGTTAVEERMCDPPFSPFVVLISHRAIVCGCGRRRGSATQRTTGRSSDVTDTAVYTLSLPSPPSLCISVDR